MLLHLELSLSLDRNRLPSALLSTPFLESLSALLHALSETPWCLWLLHIQEWRRMCGVCDLSVGVGALLDGQGSSVRPVLNLLVCGLQASRQTLSRVHRNWCWWWVERLVAAVHDVLWEWDNVGVALELVEVVDIGLLIDGCAKLIGLSIVALLIKVSDGARQGGNNVGDAVCASALGEDRGESIIGDGFREWRGNGDWAVEREE